MTAHEYLKTTISFWKYKGSKYTKILKERLATLYSSAKEIFIYENGRTALYEYLKSLNLPKGSNVAVTGFTCNAVINPILWLGLNPLYIDIDPNTLNMDPADLRKKINPDTKVIIAQHSFGNMADMDSILEIAKANNIKVIEDCAHALGIKKNGKLLGSFGDAAMLSFGIEKILSTRVGGALVVNKTYNPSINNGYQTLNEVSYLDTFLWLINPLIWVLIRKLGTLGSKLAKLLRSLGIINMGFNNDELKGKKPHKYPRKLSNALSMVVVKELDQLTDNLDHRTLISNIYENKISNNKIQTLRLKNHAFVKFPIIMESSQEKDRIESLLVKNRVPIKDWYSKVVYPSKVNLNAMKYVNGTCPVAESITKRILNLPTGKGIMVEYAESIVRLLNNNDSFRN
ncbi:DegT/DnrJ/EryC1/StrS family aminotransferase [Candidatus Dojkabacteria bacterium]|nr:DegT/DnrJ/EryC1/StrS family aminotransferase [Candidatus Dojkabacteria bacterium]